MPALNTEIIPNIKQKECIESIEGPVMVLAGPGTGKTFTIIQRIKNMIITGINPENILCLTFSETAANEMKSRIVKEVGIIASCISINTYHSFCNNLIKQYPNKFELLDGIDLIDDITKHSLMEQVIEEYNPTFYKTKWGSSAYYISELLKVVDKIKSNQVSKKEYFNTLNTHPLWQGKMDELNEEYKERENNGKLVKTFLNTYETHKKKMGKAKEAWEIFEQYDLKLKQNNFIDFNDMINLVLEELTNDTDFLEKISSQYKYFLVDEYQDTNYAQNAIVFLLAEGAKSNNIFVVGDDDQIIYEFQGAKTDTIEKFLIKYPQTKVICLNENNRSTQNILDFSYSIISQDKTRLEFNKKFSQFNISKKLTAKNKNIIPLNKKVEIHGFSDIKQEDNFIIKQIEGYINSDILPLNMNNEKDLSKIAILTRENNELLQFADLLRAKNIQFQIKESKSIFDIKSSLLTYFYLKAVSNCEMNADKLYGLLLFKPFEFALNDYNYLLEQNRLNHKDFIFNIKKSLTTHKWNNALQVSQFIQTYDSICEQKSILSVKDLIVNVINQTGILNYFMNSEINKSENIYAIKKLVDEAQSYTNVNKGATLEDFLNHLDKAFSNNLPVLIDKDDFIQNAVQLLTLHSAKGKEFDFVFIPHLYSKKWEDKKVTNTISLPINKEESNTDEEQQRFSEQLRLLFVGVTRAKYYLTLTYSNTMDSKPLDLTSYLTQPIQNQELVQTYNHELSESEYLNEILLGIENKSFDYKKAFNNELSARIKQFTLSPSSLNCYLQCPKNFLYTYILKIPINDTISEMANYGDAFHKSLEQSINIAKNTLKYPDKCEFIDILKNNLSKKQFTNERIRNEFEQRILKSGSYYYKYFSEIPFNRIYATEYYLEYVPFEQYFIKGFIDRIEKNSDGTFELYDYKTGSAKTKSQIADGKSYENYLNQLRFYKLAFELKNPNYKVTKAGLIFVEEPDSNFYIKLTDEDTEIIKEKIRTSYTNIYNLDFKEHNKDESNCEYCAYKHLCKLEKINS